ncbi:hypothetical protein Pfo_029553 [Paulownia fortunei]|nr:hypothetical protein Pfo_029553 [Paulownia fortunei]
MAYVDHAFSISDDDIMMEIRTPSATSPQSRRSPSPLLSSFSAHLESSSASPWPSIKSGVTVPTVFPLLLRFFFSCKISGFGIFELLYGLFFAILGGILFIPGFYYTRIAYYAYKGYKGFSFSNIPPV